MDQQKLRSLVFEKTGVKIDIDDPVFALVALNEAVLEDAVQRHVALIDAASQELAQQARLAGGVAAQAPSHKSAHDASNEIAPDHPPGYVPTPAAGPVRPIATQSPAVTPRELRLLGAAAGIALLSALIVLSGQAAFRKPAPALTAEQAQALQNADKMEKALQKLDPKLRAQLPVELQK
ncbi:hypothetical protein GJ697_12060 [Pseudoduganella sp. FT25W]|jgi:hypothetical protein|uniref:Uncharacterized protein n=1 Tax=Duganella alba TaxID=2666081 RepID=A0A6L5QFP2_9BURK|nr:hypothetical protein [Duganella alba]MRX08574.1 hypothetical protein [Duganella alba]MRX16952.1 hypothetical protein [Duganella alba]